MESITLGDLDGSGSVTIFDSLYLARNRAGWQGYENISMAADVNQDGLINISDSLTLARHRARWPGYEVLGPRR